MEIPTTRGPCAVAADRKCDFTSPESFPDKSGKVGPQRITRCRHCGVGITLPPLADVAFLYDDRTGVNFQPKTTTGMARLIKLTAFRRQIGGWLKQLPEQPRRVLDFGSGNGLGARALSDMLPGVEVVGSDFLPTPPAELEGRPYCPFDQLAGMAGSFDLVVALHVLEHDDDALGLLNRIAGMARPGGLVVIEVPHVDCVWSGVLGQAWDLWDTPFHRTHFSRASLAGIFKAADLDVVTMRDGCVPTFGRTLANVAGAQNSLPFLLAGAALHPIQWAGEKITGRPSALRAVARRRGPATELS